VTKRKEYRIIGGKKYWLCPACKKWKQSDDYYKSKVTWSAITSQCKKCHIDGSVRTRNKINNRRLGRESMRRQRQANPEKFRKREREASRKKKKGLAYRAYRIVHRDLRNGTITKPTHCQECNRRIKLTAHHADYTKPLEIEWLCYGCHGRRHWEI